MRKIGVIYGMENTFPPALVERINQKKIPGIVAESIRVGCTKIAEPSGYAVLVDRISHDIEFYRAYLKNASVTGTCVLNDPSRTGELDRFYVYSVAAKAGVAVPRAIIIPQKEHPAGTTVQSMRNLKFPLDWEEMFAYIRFPALFRAVKAGRWKGALTVHSADEFFSAYDQSGSSAMMLECVLQTDQHFRCYVVGENARVIKYDSSLPHGRRYSALPESPGSLPSKMARDAREVCRGLDLDVAMVEFAIQEGVPYLVDVLHASPDGDSHSLGEDHFEWLVENVAQLAIESAAGRLRKLAAQA